MDLSNYVSTAVENLAYSKNTATHTYNSLKSDSRRWRQLPWALHGLTIHTIESVHAVSSEQSAGKPTLPQIPQVFGVLFWICCRAFRRWGLRRLVPPLAPYCFLCWLLSHNMSICSISLSYSKTNSQPFCATIDWNLSVAMSQNKPSIPRLAPAWSLVTGAQTVNAYGDTKQWEPRVQLSTHNNKNNNNSNNNKWMSTS